MGKSNLKTVERRRSQLLGLLRSQEYWTTSRLADELEISQRTLQRDLQDLRDMGYPIEADRGRGGGLSLPHRWGMDRLQLSHTEVIHLLVALAITEKLDTAFVSENLKSIRQKISLSFPDGQRKIISSLRSRILIGEPASSQTLSTFIPPSKSITDLYSKGFFERRVLIIKYQNEKNQLTKRTIEPHFLMLNWPIWYSLCWDHLRNDIRVFRIDRIEKIETLNQNFQLRNKDQFLDSFLIYFKNL